MYKSLYLTCLAAMLAGLALTATPAAAQYFGRNKVQYDDFDFKILRTEHFDIYFYAEEEEAVRDAARMAERWYRRHSRTFLREFKERKPLIFYANDADFQQTNVIGGFIGEGTGGVTEALKQRVVMPLTGSYKETDHVLGHELIHSFQYDIAFSQDDSMRFSLGLLPLWLVEGMAEYLSVGRVDPHTAMWLRDAALRDDLPSTEQLTRDMYKYFPYRYGQAYMAYIGGKYGDGAVANLYKLAGRAGVDSAFVYALGITSDSLSNEWRQVVKDTYLPLMEGRTEARDAGRLVLADSIDAGNMNISPAVSPDGKYIAFLSERDIINVNLFIADAETGRIVKKLIDFNSDTHFDALRFINSAGTWSPDGKRFAFVTFAQGDNEIAIFNVDKGDIERRVAVEGVGAIQHPAWSPDGKSIAFAGLHGGVSDLYLLDVESRQVRQLTNDRHADLQPAWSPDGQTLAFTTDRGDDGIDFQSLDYVQPRLALIDLNTEAIQVLAPFGQALHHNPQFSPDGRNLYFISDQDGFKDVYRLELDGGLVNRITYLKTGVSGITNLSPAMTVAAQSGRMVFSVYSNSDYSVFSLEQDQMVGEPVAPLTEGIASASVLPPLRAVNEGLVGNYLDDPLTGLPPASSDYAVRDYKPRLRLDYVAPPSVGASFGGPWGTRVGGGVAFYFSDMLGDQNLAIVAMANGTIRDVGGQAYYVNQGDRLNWGASAGHIPVLYGRAFQGYDPVSGNYHVYQVLQRIFVDQVSGLAAYPFTTTRRAEGSLGFVRYGFHYELEEYVYSYYGGVQRIRRSQEDFEPGHPMYQLLDEPPAEYFFQSSAAYVGDYSQMGFTSPMLGGRYRFQVAPMIGSNKFVSLTADYRRYLYFKPFTFAVRGLHIGNYGADESRSGLFWREYIGYPYYQGYVRGYNINSFDPDECTSTIDSGIGGITSCPEYERLFGSRIGMASAELRIPVLGYPGLALVDFPYLPLELSFFGDAGIAWTADEAPVFKFDRDSAERIPVTSAGVSARVNVLGAVVLEVFYAYPFQRPEQGWTRGLMLMPGW